MSLHGNRRLIFVRVSPTFLSDLCKTGEIHWRIEGLPQDAVFVRWFCDPTAWYDSICFVFQHPTFQELQPGYRIPEFGGMEICDIHRKEE